MKIKILHPDTCADGSCPTIYETDRNSFLIQGFILSKEDKEKINLPESEDVIEVPADFLASFLKKNQLC